MEHRLSGNQFLGHCQDTLKRWKSLQILHHYLGANSKHHFWDPSSSGCFRCGWEGLSSSIGMRPFARERNSFPVQCKSVFEGTLHQVCSRGAFVNRLWGLGVSLSRIGFVVVVVVVVGGKNKPRGWGVNMS